MRTKSLIACSISLWAAAASAAPTDFPAGSLIIPMDVCNQPSQPYNGSSYSGTTPTSTFYATTGCPETQPTARDGLLKAYGLVYRLLQNGVTVYYILDPTKPTVDGTDVTVTNAAGTPVTQLNHSTGLGVEFMNSTHTSITYRGAPFVIAAGADATKALALIQSDPTINATDPRTGRTMFQDVQIHIAKVNILQAPVRAIMQKVPPKIALLDIGGAAIGVLQGYLKDAGLYSSTAALYYPSIGDVFTNFDNVSDFTTSDGLNAGGFSILWAPHWDSGNDSATDRDAIVAKISAFVDAGHPQFVVAQVPPTVRNHGGRQGQCQQQRRHQRQRQWPLLDQRQRHRHGARHQQAAADPLAAHLSDGRSHHRQHRQHHQRVDQPARSNRRLAADGERGQRDLRLPDHRQHARVGSRSRRRW